MPLQIPNLDDRTYQQLLDEALDRIPVHNPEWTNFNKSDPGVTLLELFAFLTEALLYRANQIPERNRKKFLSLLGLPLRPASSAHGLIVFQNERGPLQTTTLMSGLEVRAGQVPFRTESGLDVLPVEAVAYVKQELKNTDQRLRDYYDQLYSSYRGQPAAAQLKLYETKPLESFGIAGVDLLSDTVEPVLWIALLARRDDARDPNQLPARLQEARDALSGKALSLGLVPIVDVEQLGRRLPANQRAGSDQTLSITVEMPKVPPTGGLTADRIPAYRTLRRFALPLEPAVVEILIPSAGELILWNNLDPLEPGADKLPPALDDTSAEDRLITWLKLTWPAGAPARLLWAGINCVQIQQRTRVTNELLPPGDGRPDQAASVANRPVLPGSTELRVLPPSGTMETWHDIADLMLAGPEVPVPNVEVPPGTPAPSPRRAEVYLLDAEAGQLRFGDGFRGKRPPLGAELRVTYDYSMGASGNVAAGAINSAATLPAGIKVTNPLRTWGGADAESVGDGEKRIPRFLQHRERLVTALDFELIARRTPGVDVGRVEVLPGYHPQLSPNEPGDAPGAVTLMLIPKHDAAQPDAPRPDQLFLNTVCEYLDLRRLITTEVFLRGPLYQPIWISVGVNSVAGKSAAEIREAVETELRRFLSPLPSGEASDDPDDPEPALNTPYYAELRRGWRLRKAVERGELIAVVSRVPGVASINTLLLAHGDESPSETVPMRGLDLPRVAGISVSSGDPLDLDAFRGLTRGGAGTASAGPPTVVPVPVIPTEC
jgi:hypothetical protein